MPRCWSPESSVRAGSRSASVSRRAARFLIRAVLSEVAGSVTGMNKAPFSAVIQAAARQSDLQSLILWFCRKHRGIAVTQHRAVGQHRTVTQDHAVREDYTICQYHAIREDHTVTQHHTVGKHHAVRKHHAVTHHRSGAVEYVSGDQALIRDEYAINYDGAVGE